MNEQSRRRPQSVVGGADMRERGQMPQKTRAQRLEGIRQSQPQREEYSQMPLRPMTPMPREQRRPPNPPQPPKRPPQRPPMQGQRPSMQGQRPPVQGQRPPRQGQRPPMQGQRPPMQGQRPPVQGQRPPVQGQRPPRQGQRPPAQGQRPPVQGQRPPVQGQRPPMQGQRPPKQGQRPQRPPQNKRPPEKRPNNGWVIPEGSPVYTSEGRMYEAQNPQRPPRPNQGNPQRRGVQNGRPAPNGQRPPRPTPPPKKKKIFNKEKIIFCIKTFFIRLSVMLLIVSILGFWWYRSEFYSETEAKKGKVSFVLDGVGSYTVKASTAYRGDVLYCDFTEMAQWFGMVSIGSVNSMRFICTEGISETSSGKGSEEYAIFTSGSTTVLINGVTVILEAPCRTVDSHIWIPLSFVENYVSGITCDRGAKGTNIVIAPEGMEEGEDKKDEEIVIEAAFKVKAQNGLLHVEYPE